MEGNNDYIIRLHNHLITAYKTVITDYNESSYNENITIQFAQLLDDSVLIEFNDNLERFMQNNAELIHGAINSYKDVDMLFCHPVILMVLYMILNHQNMLIKNWPYDFNYLVHIVKGMNFSDDILH